MNDEARQVVPLRQGSTALTAADIKAQVQRIQQVMQAVMKENVHYGQIPGTPKPTLYKAGSEVLLTTFHIAVDPEIEDLSTHDEVRYRIRARGIHQATGIVMGTGVGECSSSEEKYRWRFSVCQEEFDDTPEDRKRLKYKRGRDGTERVQQIRTAPADVANTVLKMAKKRAQIDLCLTALAASDCFTQDLEDMPEEMLDAATEAPARTKPATQAPRATDGAKTATGKQLGLIGARLQHANIDSAQLCDNFGIEKLADLPFAKVDAALEWISQVGE